MKQLMLSLIIIVFLAGRIHAQDDPYDISLQRIQAALESGATELDLSGLGLTELPPEIGQLTNLEVLNVAFNELVELPPEIGQLSNLEGLYLSDNQLTALPLEIIHLTNLDSVRLFDNPLEFIEFEDINRRVDRLTLEEYFIYLSAIHGSITSFALTTGRFSA